MKITAKKITALALSFFLFFEQAGFAQISGQVDLSGVISGLNKAFTPDKSRPLHLRFLAYDNSRDTFDLLVDKGDTGKTEREFLEENTKTLLNYFLIGVTLPNDAFWVNLRPDAPDNIIDAELARTDVGRIMLEADVQLKKDTAGYTSPDTPEGREYWQRLYARAEELYGAAPEEIPTVTRPWIVPDEIIIRQAGDSAYIYKATLKVMLEQDYLKVDSLRLALHGYKADDMDSREKALNEYSARLMRELVIPKITRRINSAKVYAPLRQVYYSLILAQWFKSKFYGRGGGYSSLIDKKELSGLTSKTPWSKSAYFAQYRKSFTDGEYKIKKPISTLSGQSVRSYVSGGIELTKASGVFIEGNPFSRFWSRLTDLMFSVRADAAGKIQPGFPAAENAPLYPVAEFELMGKEMEIKLEQVLELYKTAPHSAPFKQLLQALNLDPEYVRDKCDTIASESLRREAGEQEVKVCPYPEGKMRTVSADNLEFVIRFLPRQFEADSPGYHADYNLYFRNVIEDKLQLAISRLGGIFVPTMILEGLSLNYGQKQFVIPKAIVHEKLLFVGDYLQELSKKADSQAKAAYGEDISQFGSDDWPKLAKLPAYAEAIRIIEQLRGVILKMWKSGVYEEYINLAHFGIDRKGEVKALYSEDLNLIDHPWFPHKDILQSNNRSLLGELNGINKRFSQYFTTGREFTLEELSRYSPPDPSPGIEAVAVPVTDSAAREIHSFLRGLQPMLSREGRNHPVSGEKTIDDLFMKGRLSDDEVILRERADKRFKVVFDLEGTLAHRTGSRWVPEEDALAVLKACRDAGDKVIIWTEQTAEEARRFLEVNPEFAGMVDLIITRDNFPSQDEEDTAVLKKHLSGTALAPRGEGNKDIGQMFAKDIRLLGNEGVLVDNDPRYYGYAGEDNKFNVIRVVRFHRKGVLAGIAEMRSNPDRHWQIVAGANDEESVKFQTRPEFHGRILADINRLKSCPDVSFSFCAVKDGEAMLGEYPMGENGLAVRIADEIRDSRGEILDVLAAVIEDGQGKWYIILRVREDDFKNGNASPRTKALFMRAALAYFTFQEKIIPFANDDYERQIITFMKTRSGNFLLGIPEEELEDYRFISAAQLDEAVKKLADGQGVIAAAFGEKTDPGKPGPEPRAQSPERKVGSVPSVFKQDNVEMGVPGKNDPDRGGVDFSVLPTLVQPASLRLRSQLPVASYRLDPLKLKKEWREIEGLVNAGIIPSDARIEEYWQACRIDGVTREEAYMILQCLARIMRLEEARDLPTSPDFQRLLGALEERWG